MEKPFLTIGEVAERAHVATSAIRYYERVGLLVVMPEPQDNEDITLPPYEDLSS